MTIETDEIVTFLPVLQGWFSTGAQLQRSKASLLYHKRQEAPNRKLLIVVHSSFALSTENKHKYIQNDLILKGQNGGISSLPMK